MDEIFKLFRPFIGKPLNILIVVTILLIIYFFDQSKSNYIKINIILWTVFLVWESLVKFYTPGANIRVDLLLIVPILTILAIYGIFGYVYGF